MQETWVRSLGWKDTLEKGTGYPLLYSGLENSMHGVALGATEWNVTFTFFQVYSQVIQLDMWKSKSLSYVWLFLTPWTLQPMEFSRPEYWSGERFPSPRESSQPSNQTRSPPLQVDSLPAEPLGKSQLDIYIFFFQILFPYRLSQSIE